MILNVNNFIRPPSFGDRMIYILDPNGNIVVSIDPYSSEFYNRGSYVHILSDGKININNLLQFNTDTEAITAVGMLNDAKKSLISSPLDTCSLFSTFIPLTGSTNISGSLIPNNSTSDIGSVTMPWRHIYVSGSTIYMDNRPISIVGGTLGFDGQEIILTGVFDTHTGNTQHLLPWMWDSLLANSGATATNPYATIGDLKKTEVSATDLNDDYLINKITGSTYINISKTGTTGSEVLSIAADLSDYYNRGYIDGISGSISGATDTVSSELHAHTGDTSIHFTKNSILLDDLGDVNTSGSTVNNVLRFSGGTWSPTSINNLVNTGYSYSTSESDSRYVSKSGSTITGDIVMSNLSGLGTGSVSHDNTGKIVPGNLTSVHTSRSNTGIVDLFDKTGDFGVTWNYVVRNGTVNVRTGIIHACWDTNGTAVEYNSTSTTDIGITSDIWFYVDVNAEYVRLWANCSHLWDIRILRILI